VTDLGAVAERLFEGVMAPLVLGGPLRPCHAIGERAALSLGEKRSSSGTDLAARVEVARVRAVRRIVPIDNLPGPSAADWALAAALNDVLQATNPGFCTALRRPLARRILRLACATIERVPPPRTVGEAVARHSWLARLMEVARTDTTVSWWTGSRTFFGVDAPGRLTAWPGLRRVRVTRTAVPVASLQPVAVESAAVEAALAGILARTPLTDVATCTREAPRFVWTTWTLGLVSSRGGQTLALRAVARLEPSEVAQTLERATRELRERGGAGDPGGAASAMLEEWRVRSATRARTRP